MYALRCQSAQAGIPGASGTVSSRIHAGASSRITCMSWSISRSLSYGSMARLSVVEYALSRISAVTSASMVLDLSYLLTCNATKFSVSYRHVKFAHASRTLVQLAHV